MGVGWGGGWENLGRRGFGRSFGRFICYDERRRLHAWRRLSRSRSSFGEPEGAAVARRVHQTHHPRRCQKHPHAASNADKTAPASADSRGQASRSRSTPDSSICCLISHVSQQRYFPPQTSAAVSFKSTQETVWISPKHYV